jgi:hypothetical protein
LAQAPHWTTTQRPAELSCASVIPVGFSMPAIVCSLPTLHRRHDAAGKKMCTRVSRADPASAFASQRTPLRARASDRTPART